jgi:hypothetical protein
MKTPVGPARAREPIRPAVLEKEVPMNFRKLVAPALIATFGAAAVVVSIAVAEPSDEAKSSGQPAEMQLPPGWTQADMQACTEACTPGKMQEQLRKGAGTWEGKTTMWMMPDAEPATSDCTMTLTPIFDGRYVKCEMAGEMPGMGPYNGLGTYGFDNVSQQFVSTWIDNHSTGIMTGVGELSKDGKTLTWHYTFNCPLNKKPVEMREVQTVTGENTRTLEMWGPEPKSGKVYKIMHIELTRKS